MFKKIYKLESHSLPRGQKYLDKLGKFGFLLFRLGIKLGIIKRYGLLTVIVKDGKTGKEKNRSRGHNLIPDVAVKHLGDILIGAEASNIVLSYMEPDTGTTDPAITNTDTETAPTPANRMPITLSSRSTTTPFEITLELHIASSDYTRPFTIRKMAIFWGPDETGDLFAIGKLDTPITVTGTDAVDVFYAFVFR